MSYGPPGPLPPPQRSKKKTVWVVICVILGLILLSRIGNAVNEPSSPGGSATKVTLQPAKGPPLFSDTFANNSQEWPILVGSGYSTQISNGRLILSQKDSNRFFSVALPGDKSYSDFRLDMTFLFLQGDAKNLMGLEFRRPDGVPLRAARGYFFLLDSEGQYEIGKALPPDPGSQDVSKVVSLGASTLDNPLAQGQPITLTVIAKGPTIAFYINNAFVAAVNDTTYTTGTVRIVLDNQSSTQTMEAAVQSIAIYLAPDQIPTPTL